MAKKKQVIVTKDQKLPAKKEIQEAVSTEVVVASLEKQAGPAFKKLGKVESITTQEDFDLVGDQLKFIKDVDKLAHAEEASMINPIKSSVDLTIKRIKTHFKPFHDKVTKLETDYKNLMLGFMTSQAAKAKQIEEDFTSGKIKKISTVVAKTSELQINRSGAAKPRKIWKMFIVDEKKIPREFLVPDESAITNSFKEGNKVSGCEYKQIDSISI